MFVLSADRVLRELLRQFSRFQVLLKAFASRLSIWRTWFPPGPRSFTSTSSAVMVHRN